ncbi:hypothetical protein DSECCO2_295850 [anaerobic digester metagenome]
MGLRSTYKLCKRHGISFTIEELSDNSLYFKKVSLFFDGLSQYIIKSDRGEEIKLASVPEDIVFIL